MCGRFIMTVDFEMIKAAFRLRAELYDLQPRYNIAPGQDIPVITNTPGGREISPMRWGLIPHWAKDTKIGYKMINARAETVGEKPAFKGAFRRRRCLIPASGFYEWKKEGKVKQPMLITLPGEKVFALAGIWEHWLAPDGSMVYSCSIITTKPNKYLEGIHNRMPVILAGEQEYEPWLSLDDPLFLQHLLRPYEGDMSVYPVTTRVNSPLDDDPGLIEPHDD
ncbi:MAG: hypothetical protein VR67_14005 [Peptococcaceae bacterium BRH_c8a]|nr:MAG: hypothetical protein VR67_14005 [Peptococcaceae bacterium BRH_c8a]